MTGVVIVKERGTLTTPTPKPAVLQPPGAATESTPALLKPFDPILSPGDQWLPAVHRLPDNPHALVATRNGWLFKLDLAQSKAAAQVKLATSFSLSALSAAHVAWPTVLLLSSEEPPALLVVNEQLQTIKSLPLVGADGTRATGVLAMKVAANRRSFVVGFKHLAELWEISFDPKSPEIGLGLVHDFQYREGHFVSGYLNPKRTTLPCAALAMALAPAGDDVLTLQACAATTTDVVIKLQVFHLDVRKPTGQTALACLPMLEGGTLPWPAAPTLPQLTLGQLAGSACTLR